MEEQYSIKDDRTEAVMWIFYRDSKVVIEKRPASEQGDSECVPCGHIDLNRDKGDYIESAFLREVSEEFQGVKPTNYSFLKTVDFDEPNKDGGIDNLRLHYFLVTKWDGEVPEHTIEEGKIHSDLVWYPISKYKELPQECDREALEEVVKKLGL